MSSASQGPKLEACPACGYRLVNPEVPDLIRAARGQREITAVAALAGVGRVNWGRIERREHVGLEPFMLAASWAGVSAGVAADYYMAQRKREAAAQTELTVVPPATPAEPQAAPAAVAEASVPPVAQTEASEQPASKAPDAPRKAGPVFRGKARDFLKSDPKSKGAVRSYIANHDAACGDVFYVPVGVEEATVKHYRGCCVLAAGHYPVPGHDFTGDTHDAEAALARLKAAQG